MFYLFLDSNKFDLPLCFSLLDLPECESKNKSWVIVLAVILPVITLVVITVVVCVVKKYVVRYDYSIKLSLSILKKLV